MTQAAIGGPAQTVYPVASRDRVTGRDAQRVFVVADGRPIEGGPQQAVYYVTDAEIAAGDFVISGNKPIPIVEVGQAGAEYPPIAVYVVTANSESDFPPVPEPPPADPIGDALRADAVAYWTMNEGSGTRVDATLRGNDLPDPAIFGTVESITGKIGKAVNFPFEAFVYLQKSSTADLTLGNVTHTWFGWIKFNDTADSANVFGKGSALETNAEYTLNFSTTIAYGLLSGNTIKAVDSQFIPTIGEWFFFECGFAQDTQTEFIRINNGSPQTRVLIDAPVNGAGDFEIGNTPVENLGGEHAIDEMGLLKRLLSQDERDYLYNSGAGRALFP